MIWISIREKNQRRRPLEPDEKFCSGRQFGREKVPAWKKAESKFMCILVKEKSDILPRLKEGDVLSVKYHPTDSGNPSEYMETKIRHMTKNDHGRLKGHYIVDLEILESQNSKKIHEPYF